MKNNLALVILGLWLACAAGLMAQENASPLAEQDASTEPPVSSTPSYYSLAEIWAYEWGNPDVALKGASLFLDGKLLGTSPVALKTLMVNKTAYDLSAHLGGYREASRPAVRIPQEGVVKIAMLPDYPDLWYTVPAYVVGLGLVVGGLVATNSSSNAASTPLIASGLGVMGLTYTISWIRVPILEKAVASANAKND